MKRSALLLVLLLAVAPLVVAACGEEENGGAVEPTTPAATAPAEDADGAAVFAGQCAGCHDEDGSGGIGPDLRGEDDLAEIESRVRSGGGGMPGFEESLSDAEISAVVEYVTGL
ncbi:MAG: cytochrome c [Thermoleophilia bacterium]|nr:cytochrome c [Thermoleophilia bacterium]